jgi:glycosyltransferase involved in cell wall biosynthesis
MRVCFLSKFPPIQGGVSTHCYWGARGLAARGHEVHVVTNAEEVEPEFRIALDEEDRAPGGELAPAFPGGGAVHVHSTQPPDRRRLYYIPLGNPTVTRLAAIAADVIRREGCEVIFAYYLEPYAVAAHLASRWTGVPYVVKHAGSDLNRLLPQDDLRTTYVEVLGWANRIVTRGASRRRLLELGLDERRMSADVAFGVPTEAFRPDAPALRLPRGDDDLPVLGAYGKLGEYKGTFDLVEAMALLVHDGFPFRLLAVAHGWQERRLRELVRDRGLEPLVELRPFLPPWRVPALIRAVRAVAFLERDFPIAAHTPTIPSEVVACATCLVLSGEVARKQPFRAQVRNLRNLVVVPDPKRHEQLAARLRYALEDPRRAAAIGARALRDFGTGHRHEDFVAGLERLLQAVAEEAPLERRAIPRGSEEGRRDPLEMVGELFPLTRARLDAEHERRLRDRVAGTALGRGAASRAELAEALGEELAEALAPPPGEPPSTAAELCRYERALHRWAGPAEEEPAADELDDFTPEAALASVARLREEVEIAHFAVDVEAIATAIQRDEPDPEASGAEGVDVLFARGRLPLRINPATAALLSVLGDGARPTPRLLDALLGPPAGGGAATDSLLGVLEGLHWERIVALDPCEPTTSGAERSRAAPASLEEAVHA